MNPQKKTRGNEILIAIIGLIGVLVTAGFSNWDKIFPDENIVQATFSGYRPTDNFETEMRHFFDVSGARQAIEEMQKQYANSFILKLSAEHPEESGKIQKLMNASLEEAITVDEVIKKFMPVYKKHFSIKELQELNKFYSTEIMQDMIKKNPLIMQDIAPLQVELINDFMKRYMERVNKILD